MSSGSRTTSRMRIRPPHLRQPVTSMANTRRRLPPRRSRRSDCCRRCDRCPTPYPANGRATPSRPLATWRPLRPAWRPLRPRRGVTAPGHSGLPVAHGHQPECLDQPVAVEVRGGVEAGDEAHNKTGLGSVNPGPRRLGRPMQGMGCDSGRQGSAQAAISPISDRGRAVSRLSALTETVPGIARPPRARA
jgi:hypothetical protein